METRGLITRNGSIAERLITATAEGRRLTTKARSAHAVAVAVAVRDELITAVPSTKALGFWATIETLGKPPGERTPR